MTIELDDVEARVVGCLLEKERSTPENYPLTTNALTTAANQKTSRDPVMDLSDVEVDAALLRLREKGWARSLRPSGSRSWKHRHVVGELLAIDDAESAVLAVLLLRGAQTAGELRTRTERLHSFDDVAEVEAALGRLAAFEPQLARNVGRGPGQSQDRWEHSIPGPEGVAAPTPVRAQSTGRGDEFRRLHESFFIMPNPWDRGSAVRLEARGFPALATTSAGLGRALGRDDQQVDRDELVRHVEELASVITVPLNVDSERLYPGDAGGITRSVELLAAAGASGCSIEDFDPSTRRIVPVDQAVAAVAEAAEACRSAGLVLTARAENHLYGAGDLDDTVARLRAFEEAGADVVYAPGLTDLEDVELVVAEVGVPVNVLALAGGPTMSELEAVGVRRVSIGGALFNAAYRVIDSAADELLGPGTSTYSSS